MKRIVYASLLFVLFACKTQKNELKELSMSEYTGLLQNQGMTSYQYGTHTLETKESFYALKSETVKLDNYIGKTVTLTAVIVDGYPVDGGPKYLNVISVK